MHTIIDWGTADSNYAVIKQCNEIRGKGGDDIIFGYSGGDRISGVALVMTTLTAALMA